MTLLSDLVNQVRSLVLSDIHEVINNLGANIGSGDLTISLAAGQTLDGIQAGQLLEIDYELMLVNGTPTSASIPVLRGWYGSTPASHSVGAVITVNPRFPQTMVINAINQDINSYSAPANGMFFAKEMTLTYIPTIIGYDMTDVNSGIPVTDSEIFDLLEVRAHDYGPFQRWPLIPLSKIQLQRNADTSIFPSGLALEIKGGELFPGQPIRVQYKAPYTTPLVNATDNVLTVTGLQTTAHDIPVLGAAHKIMPFRELKRSFTEAQPEPRREQEVPVGSSLTAMKGIEGQRLTRISEERSRLKAMYPQRWR